MSRLLLMGLLASVSLLAAPAARSPGQDPPDGPKTIFRDDLLDNLVGEWNLSRKIQGHTGENAVKVEWVLNHQFLQIHMKDVKPPPAYEAIVMIGYSHADRRYVAHWMDTFGGKASETLGFGTRSGNSIKFAFAYPDGPFRTTFTWDPEAKTWTFLMEQQGKDGRWTTFAEDKLQRPR